MNAPATGPTHFCPTQIDSHTALSFSITDRPRALPIIQGHPPIPLFPGISRAAFSELAPSFSVPQHRHLHWNTSCGLGTRVHALVAHPPLSSGAKRRAQVARPCGVLGCLHLRVESGGKQAAIWIQWSQFTIKSHKYIFLKKSELNIRAKRAWANIRFVLKFINWDWYRNILVS